MSRAAGGDCSQDLRLSLSNTRYSTSSVLTASLNRSCLVRPVFLASLSSSTMYMSSGYSATCFRTVIVDGLAGYGSGTWQTHRDAPLGYTDVLRTNSDSSNTLAGAGLRFPIQVKSLTLEPYARVLWERLTRNAFDEAMAAPAALNALSAPTYRGNGTRVSAGIVGESEQQGPLAAAFTYRFDLGAVRDSDGLVRRGVTAALAGQEFALSSPQPARTAFAGSLTGTARFMQQGYVYLGLDTEARAGKTADMGINAGVRAVF